MRAVTDPRVERAHNIDIHVGSRVRMRRKALKLSQQELAKELNLTFQQVQKYERGSNRISASKLFEISQMLHVPVSWFFEELPVASAATADGAKHEAHVFLKTIEGLELGEAFLRIPTSNLRRRVLDLIKALGNEA